MDDSRPDLSVELDPASDVPTKSSPRVSPWWFIALGLIVGIVVGRSLPPPYPDGAWWAIYLTSPGFAGSVAFFGAAIAAGVAWNNSRKDLAHKQLADQRSQWWDRFTWATEKAIAPDTAVVGMKVLDKLVVPGLATEDDARIALEVSQVVDPETDSSNEGGERLGQHL